jgi:hypothetical protein
MAKQFPSIQENHLEFILKQKMFFSASAAPDGRVNVSPKGLNTFRHLGPNEVAYLDLTGSGNETAAHLIASTDHRLTIMFCAFEDPPVILRLYGHAVAYLRGSEEYQKMLSHFEELPGARQIIHLKIDLVQTSCGYGVPLYEYQGQRPTLIKWAEAKGKAGLNSYRDEKNKLSIDGFPTGWKVSDE